MKPIEVHTQKRLIYIPFVNLFTIFITLINCIFLRTPIRVWIRMFPYLLCYSLPSSLIWAAVAHIFPSLTGICEVATMYFTPMFMSYGLIRFQKKHLGL